MLLFRNIDGYFNFMINFLLLDLLECRRHEQSLNQKISDVAMEREQLVCILKPMRMPFCILYAYRKMQKKKIIIIDF